MPPTAHSVAALKPLLRECGYTGARLKENYTFGSLTIPLVGFAAKPWDFDSACVAVMSGNGDSQEVARSCRGVGAPVVWVANNGTVDWWVQRTDEPTLYASAAADQFPAIVRDRISELDPVSIYRGKTIARVDRARQLDFVDTGLLPLLREEAGRKLHDLVENMTGSMLNALGVGEPSKEKLREVFTAVFWLLAGKILKDKGVPAFQGLDLTSPADVLSAVAKHYNANPRETLRDGKWKAALAHATSQFSGAGSFAAVSPEALAYVYEHTLLTENVRQKLGIHATPPWLVDYMVWQLYDWIRAIPEANRHVFEPACGHAPFLLSAMRLLRMEVQDRSEEDAHDYLKAHIHGVEYDDFAREIARLSLTLADIPNPNGWDLQPGDIYGSDVLANESAKCRIMLGNPPYERFGEAARNRYARAGFRVNRNKAIELVDRTLPWLPEGAVFALLLPQSVLSAPEAKKARELLLKDFEIREVCLFADKVFEEGEPESVVLLGRRLPAKEKATGSVRYRRVRENGIARFAETYEPDSQYTVEQSRFDADQDKRFCVPDLLEVWDTLRLNPVLSSIASVGQGFSFARDGLLDEARESAKRKLKDAVPALIDGHSNTSVWELPPFSWLSPSRTPVAPWRAGNYTGSPQVLLNRTRVKRGPWRLKAMLDPEGHAFKNNLLTVRPTAPEVPALFLWALLNSPVANAFIASHTMRRDNVESDIATIPLPRVIDGASAAHIVRLAEVYRTTARNRADALAKQRTAPSLFQESGESEPLPPVPPESEVCTALLALDAAVLRLYGLSPRLERRLLDYFAGHERVGVGCTFRRYYPSDFKPFIPLWMYTSAEYKRCTAQNFLERIPTITDPALIEAFHETE